MDTSLDRIRAKIAELESRIESLKIAERELQKLDNTTPTEKASAPKKRRGRPPGPAKAKVTEPAAEEAETEEGSPRQTIGSAITDVLNQHGALTASSIAEQVVASGKDVNNRAISFALQALKKRGIVKSAGGEWSLKKARKRA